MPVHWDGGPSHGHGGAGRGGARVDGGGSDVSGARGDGVSADEEFGGGAFSGGAGGRGSAASATHRDVPRLTSVEALRLDDIPESMQDGEASVPRAVWHRSLVAIDPGALGLEADGVALVKRQSRIEKGARHVLLIDGEVQVGVVEPLAKGGGWKAAIGGNRATTLTGDWSVLGLLVGVMGPDTD